MIVNDEDDASSSAKRTDQDDDTIAPCPQCGHPMIAIRGLKSSICQNCGFKDSCCY